VQDRRRSLGAGFLDVTSTVLVLIAVREGLVAVVAPIAALGPAFTVICAWLVLGEPVARIQLVGLVVAVTGLGLIAAG
jgi:drug/metabolite transporter (DMT)-like permease